MGVAEKRSRNSTTPSGASRKHNTGPNISMPDGSMLGEERFRAVWDNASDALALSNPQATVLAANRAYLELYGYSAEEVIGHNFAIIFPENLREWANEEYRKTFAGPGITPAVEATIQRKDGTERIVEARYTFVVEGNERTAMLSIVRDITDQKRAEAEAERRKQEFETLAQHLPDIITRHEAAPPFRYLYVNPAIAEATGIPAEAFAGKTYRDVCLNEQLCDYFDEHLGLVVSTGEPRTTEFTGPTPSGQRYYRSRLVPERDISGNITSVLVVSHDITDIRRAEADLRASQETFHSAFEYAPIGIALLGLDGYYRQVNPAFCTFTGYAEDELRRLTFQSLAHPEDLRSDVEALGALRRGEIGPYRMERRYIRKDGEVIWALLSVSLVHDAEGNPLHFIRQTEDITERKRAEEALKESEARFRSLVGANIIGIIEADMERIVNANDVFLDMVGYTRLDLAEGNIKWREITPPEWLSEDERALKELIARGAAAPYEKEYFHKDGHRVPILIGASLLTRSPLIWMCFVLDLTKRKQAETNEQRARAEAEQAVLDRERLLSIVAHDLRNPLTSIIGNAQVLLRRLRTDKPVDEEQRERIATQVQKIEKSGVQMKRMIEEILDFSKLQARGPLGLSDQPTELVELVSGVVQECRVSNPHRNIALNSKVAQVVGRWDPSRLRRVFSNLLDNAIKYSPQDGAVQVEIDTVRDDKREDRNRSGSTEDVVDQTDRGDREENGEKAEKEDRTFAGEWVRVRVADQGIGIPAEDLPHIFEWYRRASNASEWAGGTGLGLAGARQIVEQHRGAITIESVEGEGSTVTVLLPV